MIDKLLPLLYQMQARKTSHSGLQLLSHSSGRNTIECRAGSGEGSHRVIIVNGFLTQDDQEAKDWVKSLSSFRQEASITYFGWESRSKKELLDFGAALARGRGAERVLRLLGNPWHTAMINAQAAGKRLAHYLLQSPDETFTLIGHSLGARVIFYALLALASHPGRRIEQAILLGAAVGRKNEKEWRLAAAAVQGNLYNCYSEKDRVLKHLYQWVNLGISRPAGIAVASGPVINHDCTDLVEGHNRWIANLPSVLDRMDIQ